MLENIKIFDIKSGIEIKTLKGHDGIIRTVAITSDGRRIISGSEDKTIIIWDVQSGTKIATLTGHIGSVNSIALSRGDLRAISVSEDRSIKIWDLELKEEIKTIETTFGEPPKTDITKSPGWANREDRQIAAKEFKEWKNKSPNLNTISITSDEALAITGLSDNTLKVWDLETGKEIKTLYGHSGQVLSVAVTADEKVVSGSADNTLKVWDLATGKELRTLSGHSGQVLCVAVTNDGKIVSGSADGTLKVWALETGKELKTHSSYSGQVQAIAVTADGKLVSGSDDSTLRVWDLDLQLKNTFNLKNLSENIGNLLGACNDQPIVMEKIGDQLGFANYVNLFAKFIESKETKPPITIGIYGSWGMGKSFLLKNIAEKINSDMSDSKRDKEDPYVHLVDFNAWEFSASDVIWPGLVRKVMDKLEPDKLSIYSISKLKYLKKRFGNLLGVRWPRHIRYIFLMMFSLIFILVYVFMSSNLVNSFMVAIGFSFILSAIDLIMNISINVFKPLSQWTVNLFQEYDYGKQIGYMELIRKDLEFLEKRLQHNNERILIVIDDLDRCEPEKAVEVLQALNLLLNFNSFIVCLGIDARIITSAIEKHYENLLALSGASGYEYLEKIVQIPFRIPEPNLDEVNRFITKQLGEPKEFSETKKKEYVNLGAKPTEIGTKSTEMGQNPTETQTKSNEIDANSSDDKKISNILSVPFTYKEQQAFQCYSSFLRPNPRHIKRLINIYRLVRTLAELKKDQFILKPVVVIRWLIICGQWPFSTHLMLSQFDKMQKDKLEGKLKEYPQMDPMIFLFEELEKDKNYWPNKRKIDSDIDELRRLLYDDKNKEGRFSWDELEILQRYTINFNPAIEAEISQYSGKRKSLSRLR